MATKMFDGKIQIELDFFKIPNVMYQIGHVGISDFFHRYWPVLFVCCDGENQINAFRCLRVASEMIDANDGELEFIMVDGGTALKAAIDELNCSRLEKHLVEVILKACFTHNARMPGTRGGGKKGANGSFVRYLLEHGVKYGNMCRVSAFISPFNLMHYSQ